MALFKYTAVDQDSHKLSGKMIADDQSVVVEELRKRKLVITSVSEVKAGSFEGLSLFKSKKVKLEDLVAFSRQLATMIEAGIPLIQSLDALQEQVSTGEFKKVVTGIRSDIETGNSLSASFAKHPQIFDTLYINMVKAGESSGMLNIILERISSYLEKTVGLQRKLKSAMVYPIIVISMAIIITTILLVKVVPTFKGIFDMLGGELPMPTRILILISDILRRWLIYAVSIMGLGVFLVNRYIRTDTGRLKFDQLKLKLPVVGDLFRKVSISRFSRTLSTLIQSGVPILGALEIVGKTSGNRVIEIAVNNVKNNVREGESIAQPLIKSGVFPPMVTRMISVGEQTGELEKMLGKVADFYDEEVEAALSGLTSMIEPLIIAFLGVIVGGIVIALFLPIIKITQLLGK
ncbi:MAG: type II secretion system F family protein [Candidatus Omnitrophota bacterium]|nr:type II secretion system F family protein [Candidatus Omnitrophota bacterium]